MDLTTILLAELLANMRALAGIPIPAGARIQALTLDNGQTITVKGN